jgi:hypothetical protein
LAEDSKLSFYLFKLVVNCVALKGTVHPSFKAIKKIKLYYLRSGVIAFKIRYQVGNVFKLCTFFNVFNVGNVLQEVSFGSFWDKQFITI